MAWIFDKPLVTLSDTATVQKAEQLWEAEDLGGMTEDNNPVPRPVVWLVFLTVVTAFAITFPLWGQRPTAALYAPLVDAMDRPEVLAAADDNAALAQILAAARSQMDVRSKALLDRHPVTMDDLRILKGPIKDLEAKHVADLADYTVVGNEVVTANFEGNYRADGSRIRQQPWWDKGYTIDLFYLTAFFLGVILVVKRLPPISWQPRHNADH